MGRYILPVQRELFGSNFNPMTGMTIVNPFDPDVMVQDPVLSNPNIVREDQFHATNLKLWTYVQMKNDLDMIADYSRNGPHLPPGLDKLFLNRPESFGFTIPQLTKNNSILSDVAGDAYMRLLGFEIPDVNSIDWIPKAQNYQNLRGLEQLNPGLDLTKVEKESAGYQYFASEAKRNSSFAFQQQQSNFFYDPSSLRTPSARDGQFNQFDSGKPVQQLIQEFRSVDLGYVDPAERFSSSSATDLSMGYLSETSVRSVSSATVRSFATNPVLAPALLPMASLIDSVTVSVPSSAGNSSRLSSIMPSLGTTGAQELGWAGRAYSGRSLSTFPNFGEYDTSFSPTSP